MRTRVITDRVAWLGAVDWDRRLFDSLIPLPDSTSYNAYILGAYLDWVSREPKNQNVLPYVSMHGSTETMVEYLVSALAERGVKVHQFDLTVTDTGKLAAALVDAGTIIIGTPTVHASPHPLDISVVHLANMLRPKARFAAVIGSYGWGTRVLQQIADMTPNLGVEFLDPVLSKGLPREQDFQGLEELAA